MLTLTCENWYFFYRGKLFPLYARWHLSAKRRP